MVNKNGQQIEFELRFHHDIGGSEMRFNKSYAKGLQFGGPPVTIKNGKENNSIFPNELAPPVRMNFTDWDQSIFLPKYERGERLSWTLYRRIRDRTDDDRT